MRLYVGGLGSVVSLVRLGAVNYYICWFISNDKIFPTKKKKNPTQDIVISMWLGQPIEQAILYMLINTKDMD